MCKLRPNPGLAQLPLFSRKGLKRVRFGDVVRQLKEEVDPAVDGVERYVAGDHMESEDVHIRRWGNVGEGYLGPAFIRGFRKGQVLYGSRRTYLKKVALAEWDGVTANTTFVLEAVEGNLLQELLPWLMLSDRFTKHSVQESKGSTNPYINFSDIAKFEFALPPLDQQRRIAEILWAVDEAMEAAGALCRHVRGSRDVAFDEALRMGVRADPTSLRRLGEALAAIIAGKSPKASSSPAGVGGYGVLKVSAVGDGEYCENENKALLAAEDFNGGCEVKPGMILVTRCNALLSGVGRACLVERTRPGLMLSDKTLQLVPNPSVIHRDFLLQGLRRNPYREFIERSANGTEAKNVTQETLRAAPFWIPKLEEQDRVVAALNRFAAAQKCAEANLTRLGALRTSLLNTFMS